MATLKQLAIALNMDFKTMKAKFLADAQSSNNFEFANEISAWQPTTDIPQPLVELAKQHGLDISKKRKPSSGGVTGGLANPSEVVAGYLEMMPKLIASTYSSEQQAFIKESEFAGKMTGAAGALAFQNSLADTFVNLNDKFRQARLQGVESMQAGLVTEFNDLFSSFCDTSRLLEESKAAIDKQNQNFDEILNKLDDVLISNVSIRTPENDISDELGK